MSRLIAILGFLVAAFLALKWVASAPPERLAKMLRQAAGAAVMVMAGIVALRGGWALAVPLFLFGLTLFGLSNPFAGGGPGGRRRAGGRTSRVRTRMLAMELDHASGRMDGEVLAGNFSGRRLSGLAPDELLALRSECASAGDQSLRLLEAWLDRERPGWREKASEAGEQAKPAASEGKMTVEQARDVLGLEPGADEKAIRAAHRRLMKLAHPDHGGSDYLALQINLARDILLKEHGAGG